MGELMTTGTNGAMLPCAQRGDHYCNTVRVITMKSNHSNIQLSPSLPSCSGIIDVQISIFFLSTLQTPGPC